MWKCYGSVNIFSPVAPICIQITQRSNGVRYIHKSQICFWFFILIAQGNQTEKSVICIDWFPSTSFSTCYSVKVQNRDLPCRLVRNKSCQLINTTCGLLCIFKALKRLKTFQWRARKSKQGGVVGVSRWIKQTELSQRRELYPLVDRPTVGNDDISVFCLGRSCGSRGVAHKDVYVCRVCCPWGFYVSAGSGTQLWWATLNLQRQNLIKYTPNVVL